MLMTTPEYWNLLKSSSHNGLKITGYATITRFICGDMVIKSLKKL